MTEYYLHLGSNIGNRQANLSFAIEQIANSIGDVVLDSSLYETEAWGFETEDFFLNQAIKVKSNLSPEVLLDKALEIESLMGRKRIEGNYSSRIIDIDILFNESYIVNTESLIVPHPHIQKRMFVLVPLYEIAPHFIHPLLKKSIKQLFNDCKDKGEVSVYKRHQ